MYLPLIISLTTGTMAAGYDFRVFSGGVYRQPPSLSDPPPDRPSQLCHILSSCPGVKRPVFPKNHAVFRRNTVIFPEKKGNPGLYRAYSGGTPEEGVPLAYAFSPTEGKCAPT